MMEKQKYSFIVGLKKTFKTSAWMLIPFGLALLANVPKEYAWIVMPLSYMAKNYLQMKEMI